MLYWFVFHSDLVKECLVGRFRCFLCTPDLELTLKLLRRTCALRVVVFTCRAVVWAKPDLRCRPMGFITPFSKKEKSTPPYGTRARLR